MHFTLREPWKGRIAAALTLGLRHFSILVILSIVGLLTVGIIANGSQRALVGMAMFAGTTALTYLALLYFRAARQVMADAANRLALPPYASYIGTYVIAATAVTIALAHIIWFDGFTLGPSLAAESNIEVALIRMNLAENPSTLLNYLKAITLNALFPIGLLLAVIKRMKGLAIIVAVVGLFYSVCMMQKAGPVAMALPVLAYFVCTKRWLHTIAGLLIIVGTVYAMDLIAEPRLRPEIMKAVTPAPAPVQAPQRTEQLQRLMQQFEKARQAAPPIQADANDSIAYGLLLRIAIIPGDVVAKWFTVIPSAVPYAKGCGYRFLTPLLDCEFQNFPLSLYPRFFPEHEAMGLRGAVNSASMMTAYANFGMPGIVVSGIMHGLLAWGLFVLFYRAPELSPAFNAPYLLLLSSGELFTMLLSGGWLLSIILYVALCRPIGRA